MLLFYVDESGSSATAKGAHRAHHDFLSMAAVGVSDSSRSALAADLVALRTKYFPDHVEDWLASELKARSLWLVECELQGSPKGTLPGGYEQLKDRKRFNDLLWDIEKLLAKFRPIVFSAVVNKPSLASERPGVNPVAAAYAVLYQQLAINLENVHGGASGLLVADQQNEHEALFKSGDLKQAAIDQASKGKYRPNFDLLLDKPLWIDASRSSWDREILQLADLAAFATRAWAAQGSPPQERHFLWRAFRPHLASDWRTGTGVRGAGLVVVPAPKVFPETD